MDVMDGTKKKIDWKMVINLLSTILSAIAAAFCTSSCLTH